ncbi:Wall-associated receptor kinase 4 [Acorus calamus]|uniref:Wall-associated receptor kinase 4 n=1 Tax=Acorus calamus TaxID=4465 RepID=A0AAV9CFF0_ACOCL|nr:Wall-associated receptor kinase 4 [Acorus calamus]
MNLIVLLVFLILLSSPESLLGGGTSPPDCHERCGGLDIPYPFGLSNGCFREGFRLRCTNISSIEKLYLPMDVQEKMQITNISLTTGEVLISHPILYECYDQPRRTASPPFSVNVSGSIYTFSETRNRFTALGCDTKGVINGTVGSVKPFTMGCISTCYQSESVADGDCSGMGCCQSKIPKGIEYFEVLFESFYNHSRVMNFNPCSYVFLVDHDRYKFTPYDITDGFFNENSGGVPAVLDFSIGKESCGDARRKKDGSYACVSRNSDCSDASSGSGYFCSCKSGIGYEGNPYLQNGCQDINECQRSREYPCHGTCINTPGSYRCICPPGTEGNATAYQCLPIAKSKFPVIPVVSAIVGGTLGLLLLFGSCILVYQRMKERKKRKLKEMFFHQNKGLLLEQLISSDKDAAERTKIYTLDELEKATNNFDCTRVLGRGGYGTVYKGLLSDQRIVAIKRSTLTNGTEIDQFINEVANLSCINHRNVVKLYGSCLETEVPLLVYEFIPNGTLFHHLRDPDRPTILSWEDRLRIASEIAGALAYLHTAASITIFHRDVKSSNILLDSSYIVKVSDFGASRFIPTDGTHVSTAVQGTFGYLDPEYFYTGQLTEKSDVYSFGVILVELLTGENPVSKYEGRSLSTHFICMLKEGHLSRVLDDMVVQEGEKERVQAVAELAEVCLRMRGEERPTMKEVAAELDGLRRPKRQVPWVVAHALEETENLL